MVVCESHVSLSQFDQVIEKALDEDETDGSITRDALPTEADFVLAYATVPGSVSINSCRYHLLHSLTLAAGMCRGETQSTARGLSRPLWTQ